MAAVAAIAVGASAVVAVVSSSSQAVPLNEIALYVAPFGVASAAGTIDAPTTLQAAILRISAGGTIYMRDGTYNYSTRVMVRSGNNGTATGRKQISAYPGERPVLNFEAQAESDAGSSRGLQLDGSYWHLSGLTVERAGDNGIYMSGSNNIVERVITRYNRDTGLQIGASASSARAQWPSNNLVVSSVSHDNKDTLGENADGFAAKLTVGPGNVFRYSVAHNNVDDGWDLYAGAANGPIDPVTIEDSLAYSNGMLSDGTQLFRGDRNGFKLGGAAIAVDHVIRRSVAYGNGKHGFTWNRNPGGIVVSDNISVSNAQRNLEFQGGVSVFRNNVSCRASGAMADRTAGDADASNQFWTGWNGSRCAAYTGPMSWQFASNGALLVWFGNNLVTNPAPTPEPPAPTALPPAPR